jgi:hypothetical protein
MIYGYLKIALLLAVPVTTLLYARQVRLDSDRRAIIWDVQHPPDLHWALTHPKESLEKDRQETAYLHHLIWDLDH